MRRLALVLFVAGLLLVLTAPTQADHFQTLPGVPSKIMRRAMERGYLTYRYDDATANYPNFKPQNAAIFLDQLLTIGVEYVEITAGVPDVWLTMPDDQTFINSCGPGAAACITYANDPVVVAYRRALLYFDWKSTSGHEFGHNLGLHEQYLDNGQFACKPISQEAYPTVMNCGTGRWQLQPIDISLIRAVMVPRPISGFYGFSYTASGVFSYWCGGDTVRGTRVAIMAVAPDGTAYWSGIHRTITSGCDGIQIIGEPGWCYRALPENSFSWRVGLQRYEVELGCL
ncbi:MAG: hypothetical protein A3E01_15160 [Gammaproteobacteria bacterium RIFCSPHIGHO2_12_FULL_63_22]|nr:MAG: hypothetical protein A3E01_15160 [Gammaproteobacteria bacterium RIFCSPHIGHO2_12_FULL_63_22]